MSVSRANGDQALFSTSMRADAYSILHRLSSNHEACAWLANQQNDINDSDSDSRSVLDACGSDNGKLALLLASLEDEYGCDLERDDQQWQLSYVNASSCFAWVLSTADGSKLRSKAIPWTADLDANHLHLFWCVHMTSRYWLLLYKQYGSAQQHGLIHLYSFSCILDRQVANSSSSNLFATENIVVYSLRQKSPISGSVQKDVSLDGKSYALAHWALKSMRMSLGHSQLQYQDYHSKLLPSQNTDHNPGQTAEQTQNKEVLLMSGKNPTSQSDRSSSHSDNSEEEENQKVVSSGDATNSGPDKGCEAFVSPDPVQQYLEEVKAMDRAGRCSCKLCGADFCRKYELKRHVRTKHLIERRTFVCTVCSRKFKRKDHMTAHFKRVHTDADPG